MWMAPFFPICGLQIYLRVQPYFRYLAWSCLMNFCMCFIISSQLGLASFRYVRVIQLSPVVKFHLISLRSSLTLFHWFCLMMSSGVGSFFFCLFCPLAPYLPVCFSSTSKVSPQSHVSLMYPHFIFHLSVVSLIPLIKP